jgi:hypothetical protein
MVFGLSKKENVYEVSGPCEATVIFSRETVP